MQSPSGCLLLGGKGSPGKAISMQGPLVVANSLVGERKKQTIKTHNHSMSG